MSRRFVRRSWSRASASPWRAREQRNSTSVNVRLDRVGPLRGRLTPPADKSISHRAALIGAMAAEPVHVRNYLHAADTASTLAAVRELGVIVEEREDEVLIRGAGLRNAQAPPAPIDVGNAGTLMRLL